MSLPDPLPGLFPPTDSSVYSGLPSNPYLDYRPIFARSLPIQILFTGITLTLDSVLLVQLIFTAPYHVRLARVNFILQISAAIAVLTWEIASLSIIINETRQQSQHWPFMLEYVAIDFPPLNDPRIRASWSTAGLTAWLLMNALVSALTQMTHIQFLSLMYPSRLEAQLIFILLGPLAIVAALTQFAPLHPHLQFVLAASAVRNVCNATLSILFTLSLTFWGFVVNRKQAWRTDGGTAAFGVGAILLAIASTALTIAYIPSRDQFEWIPGLIGTTVLWQSFLGWWWWVGAGMGITEVDEWLSRAEKRRERRAARDARKKEPKRRLRGAWNTVIGGGRGTSSASSTAIQTAPPSDTTAIARGRGSDSDSLHGSTQSGDVSTTTGGQEHGSNTDNKGEARWFWPLALVRSTLRYVRNTHVNAARTRALERAEHLRKVFGIDGSPTDVSSATSGWRPDPFGLREGEASPRGTLDMGGGERPVHEERRRRASIGEAETEAEEAGTEAEDEIEWEDEEGAEAPPKPPPKPLPPSSSIWWWGSLRRWRLKDTTEYSER
ncbi:hypothetical protein BJV78DRAFT_1125046 [Lactifluus subvellereus]|nr:hypothetical protein BJV78DRAFT_1125046 [Lactifluus subvellereus]